MPPALKLRELVREPSRWPSDGHESEFSYIHRNYWNKPLDTPKYPLETSSASNGSDWDFFEGQDVIPGCQELSIPELDPSPFWVRAEYLRLFDAVIQNYTSTVAAKCTSGAVITGQPGIGKSVARMYFLSRLLADSVPVLWQDEALHLFASDGVFTAPTNCSLGLLEFTIALLDTDPVASVPSNVLRSNAWTYPVLFTSPDSSRWSRWHKTRERRPLVLYMNPWKRQELDIALPLRMGRKPLTNAQVITAHKAFDKYGPMIRTVLYAIRDVRNDFGNYEESIRYSVNSFLLHLTDGPITPTPESLSVSHGICLLRRPFTELTTAAPIVQAVSPYVQEELLLRYRSLDLEDQVRLYRRLAPLTFARTLVGKFFEELCHSSFSKQGIHLEYIKMIRRNDEEQDNKTQNDKTQKKPRHKRYDTSHRPVSDKILEVLRREQQSQPVTIHKCHLQHYERDAVNEETFEPKENVYYIPESNDQAQSKTRRAEVSETL